MPLAANAIVSWETVQAALSYQDSEQSHVEDLINKASTRAETETGRRFRAQDYSERFTGSGPFLVLPHRPVVNVSSVRVDTDRVFAATTELDSSDYYVRPGAGYITRYDGDWPDTLDSIQIDWRAGYELADVPSDLQDAVIQMIAWTDKRYGQQGTHVGLKKEGGAEISSEWEIIIPIDARRILEHYAGVGL